MIRTSNVTGDIDYDPSPVGPALSASESLSAVTSKVVAFVTDEASSTALRMGLLGLGDAIDVRSGTVRQAIRYFERESSVSAVVVDLSGVEHPLAALDDLARVCPASVKVLAIGDNTDIMFYRQLVHDIGVTEYLPKPLTRDTVQRVVFPLLSGVATDPVNARGGHVVVVCGARGGVGASTIAVSTALELATVTKGHVALLDLHLQNGTAALMLAARPGPGLRIALEDPNRVDALFLDRTAITIGDRLKLIAAEEAFESTVLATDAGVTQVLHLLRQRFNYIVVDLPMPPPRGMQRVIDLARHILVVVGPDVASIRDARAIQSLVTNSTGSDPIMTVLNRADAKGGLSSDLISKGLGREPDVKIPDLGNRMAQAVNLGVPALRRVPALHRYLAPIISEVAGTTTEQRGSWLQRMFAR